MEPKKIVVPQGKKIIFRPWITSKDGKRIYPKNGKWFPLIVNE